MIFVNENMDILLVLIILVSAATNVVMDALRSWLYSRRWRKAFESHKYCYTVHTCKPKESSDKECPHGMPKGLPCGICEGW